MPAVREDVVSPKCNVGALVDDKSLIVSKGFKSRQVVDALKSCIQDSNPHALPLKSKGVQTERIQLFQCDPSFTIAFQRLSSFRLQFHLFAQFYV